MQAQNCGDQARPIDGMTLTECVAELEALDRSRTEAGGTTGTEARREALRVALTARQAETKEDALAKFRWVLYEAQGEVRHAAVPANDLVVVMRQVAAFPAAEEQRELAS